MNGHTWIRGLKAGRRWAAFHPDAEPEVYRAKADRFAEKRGKEYANGWFEGVMCEYWKPTLDRDGQKLPDMRSYC